MNIAIVGSGYVGLVTATCLASTGNSVIGVDIDAQKVRALAAGKCPIFEPGLEELMQAQLAAGRLSFTTDVGQAVRQSAVIFIAVGTPPRNDGSADLSNVEAIISGIAPYMDSSRVIVIKSTVPVGTGQRMSDLLMDLTAHPFSLVSNPEFLKEGAALEDFLRPDRVVIGSDDPDAIQMLTELYAPFVRTPQTILVMSREAAEMVKYTSNAYLATRISFINEIADICAATGVDIAEVCNGIGADRRIGRDFLNPGVGYGGSCFPKDVQALIQVASHAGCQSETSTRSSPLRRWCCAASATI
jgi:UDPglucose 6-dehydrogenase